MIINAIIIFLLGIIFGSFLNSVIYRFYKGISLWGRSFCPQCKHKLTVLDLIPLGSFIFLLGKCRYCQKKISWQYFFVELASGILFVLFFWKYQAVNLFLIRDLLFALIFIFIFVFDLKYYLILDKIIWSGLLLAVIINLLLGFDIWNLIIGICLGAGFFGLQYLFTRGRGVGFGDVKLGMLIGALLGWQLTIICLGIAYIIGGLVAALLLITRKKGMKDMLPMGTFLALSAVIVLLFDQQLLYWFCVNMEIYLNPYSNCFSMILE